MKTTPNLTKCNLIFDEKTTTVNHSIEMQKIMPTKCIRKLNYSPRRQWDFGLCFLFFIRFCSTVFVFIGIVCFNSREKMNNEKVFGLCRLSNEKQLYTIKPKKKWKKSSTYALARKKNNKSRFFKSSRRRKKTCNFGLLCFRAFGKRKKIWRREIRFFFFQ